MLNESQRRKEHVKMIFKNYFIYNNVTLWRKELLVRMNAPIWRKRFIIVSKKKNKNKKYIF